MKLEWLKHPRRTVHKLLGRRVTWWTSDHKYYVERFLDNHYPSFRSFHVVEGTWVKRLADSRTLNAAKRQCELHCFPKN